MDTAWQSSIDRTLRSTEATLEHLQQRRTSYDRAKHKVDDYLGYSTPHRDSKGFDSLDRTDISVPPPLPQHRRYRSGRDGLLNGVDNAYSAVAAGPSPSQGTAAHDAPSTSTQNFGSRRGNGVAGRDDPTAPLQLVNAQVRGAILELELEKAKRADSIRELAYRTTAELAELRSMVTQLQSENATLRTSVRALEGKLGFTPEPKLTATPTGKIAWQGTGTTHMSFSELNSQQQQQQPSRTALLASAVANSGFGLPSDNAGVSASLLARVDALESGLARQQQLGEERQTRTATMLREMVKAEVGSDMAEVRTLAREAARDSTEELLKLRLSAVQSNVQTEVQRALRAASASETIAQQAQHQCGEVEHRLSTQMQKLNMHLLEWQRGAVSTSASTASVGGVVAFAGPASQERSVQFERAIEDELHGLRGQLRQLRQDTEAHMERLAHERKQTEAQLRTKAAADDVRGISDRIEEQQRSSGSAALREQVSAVVRPQLQPMQEALRKLQESAQEQQEAAEAWRRQAGLRFAAMEASTKDFRDEADRLDQQWGSSAHELRQLRGEVSAVQERTTDTVRQCKSELTEAWEAKLQAAEERAQQSQRERLQQLEGQVRQLQQSVAEQQETTQRTRFASDAAEERLRRVESAVATMESSVPHSVADVKTKCDALYGVLQQSCALPLSRVQQDVEGVQRRMHALDEDKTRANAVWTQQLADTKHFFEEHVRNTRDMLEQRLSHQKELYEELRNQQSTQRRYAEEQQQQLLDQLKRVQQQQQQQQQPMLGLAPAPSQVAAPVRSIEEPASEPSTEAPAVSHADKMADAEVVSVEEFHQLQQQVQQLHPHLQGVETRVEAAERAAATTARSVADAIAPVQSRLEELREQVQMDAKEHQLRLSACEHSLSDKVRLLSETCERASASALEHAKRVQDDLAAATTPSQFVACLSADPQSLQLLALQLQDLLASPSSTTSTLEELQAQVSQHTHALEELQSAIGKTQQQMVTVVSEAQTDRRAERVEENTGSSASASPEEVAAIRDGMQAALQEVHEAQAALLQRHATLEKQSQHISDVQLPALASELDRVKQATTSLPQDIQQLVDQLATLKAAQRQQLPTLQTYVQDVLDAVQESQSASLDPLQLKLRAVEERQRKLQAHLEEWIAEQETAAEQAGLSQQKRQERLRVEWETRAAAQMDAMQDTVASTHEHLTALQEKMTLLEKTQREDEDVIRDVRVMGETALAALEKKETLSLAADAVPDVAAAEADEADDGKTAATAAGTTTTMVAASSPSYTQLQSYVEELDGRLSQLEEQTSDSLAGTADALGAFGQQLQDVVSRFAVAVGGAEAGEAVTDPSSGTVEGGRIRNLEDVFAYFLHQLQQLQRALYRLQANTVETLEILELHEESTATLPMLQHTVDAIAAALVPLAERLGVDSTSFSLPTGAADRNADVYPSSCDGSDSSTNYADADEYNRA